MDELQAAILRLKLRALQSDNARRRQIAHRYLEGLHHPLIRIPAEPADPGSHVWHLFVIATAHRSSLARHLEARNIETIVHYPRAIHQQPAYIGRIDAVDAPNAERLQREVLSLPISQVMDDAQVDYVMDAVNSWTGPQPAELADAR